MSTPRRWPPADAIDGVADGVIDDPRASATSTPQRHWCAATIGNGTGCLTQAEDRRRRPPHPRWRRYRSPTASGSATTANSEWRRRARLEPVRAGCPGRVVGAGLRELVGPPTNLFDTYDASWTLNNLSSPYRLRQHGGDLDRHREQSGPRAVRASRRQLPPWHGWADQHIPPRGTIKYWHAVNDLLGDDQVSRFAKFYLFPGMAHCGSGLGPNTFDIVTPLMSWVETNSAQRDCRRQHVDRDLAPSLSRSRRWRG